MHSQGVAGKKIYLGGDCAHCHMYGLINVAAFLAQAMKETIRYDACDENSWDRVGADLMYPISNACGQLGQSYQDYSCSDEEKHMECEVDPQMSITAVTNAKWWGAPGPLKCGPKSQIPQSGHWDFMYNCDNIWATPPETCDAYEGQTGGKALNDVPYPNAAGRTDVEGCCWWGRGVIQTSGVCNFGKLNYFLGKRAADEGRDSRYPNIDFCRDPEAICKSQEHKELKWIAGFFYWISEVQPYDNEGWNYIDELHNFVDGGMEGDEFINAVSGIVNRGCHNPPCGTGELDGGPARAKNFYDVIKEMKFSFVDVVPQPDLILVPETPRPSPLPPPLPAQIPRPTFPALDPPTPPPNNVSTLLAATQGNQVPEEAFLAETPDIQVPEEAFPSARPESVRYTCGNGYQFDESDTSIPPSAEVAFDYEIHNGIDVTVGDALRDVKGSILSDIAGRMGCYKASSGRKLQDSSDVFDNIISLQSNANDVPDPDASGCIVDVETDDPTTCTPVSGGFTIYAKPGTSESSLEETLNSLKGIVQNGMDAGIYETETVDKAIYIGERDNFSKAKTPSTPINEQTEGTDESNEGMKIAIYALACACLILICLLWFTIWTYREKMQKEQKHDEEMAFDKYMMEEEEIKMHKMARAPQDSDHRSESQRRPPPPPRQKSERRNNTFATFEGNRSEEPPFRPNYSTPVLSIGRRERKPGVATFDCNGSEQALNRPRSSSRGSFLDKGERKPGVTAASSRLNQIAPNEAEEESLSSKSSSESSAEDVTPIVPQRRQPPRSQSAPRFQSSPHRRKPPLSGKASSEGGSVSSDSSDSGGSSSEGNTFNDGKQKIPVGNGRSLNGNRNSNGYSKPMGSRQSNSSSAREERQKRMAQARERAAMRRSVT